MKGKTTFETQIEEKAEVNPELDMKVTAIEPNRDDFDRLDQLQEDEATDGEHRQVNPS
jgi:hypothetical protein